MDCWIIMTTPITDVIFKALASVIPDRIPAGTKAMMCQVAFGSVDPRTSELYAFYETIAGGHGGRATSDGSDAVQTHGQNTENAPRIGGTYTEIPHEKGLRCNSSGLLTR
ncbi:TPA: hypothetical protein EYP66_20890, partial [Candidatus Poribacteria bacterium]|nr:hypothetical protein [Candidatus Poribacteria bacterium]